MFKKKHCMTRMYMRNRYKVIDNHMSMGLNVDCYHICRHSSMLHFYQLRLEIFLTVLEQRKTCIYQKLHYILSMLIISSFPTDDCSFFPFLIIPPFLSPEFLRYDWIDFPENFRGHRE